MNAIPIESSANRPPTTRRRRRDTPEYWIWSGIKNRCLNPKDTHFGRYGGRGIVICDRWKDDFATFLADVGPRPSAAHSIDRIDFNGNYEPGNCRWATWVEQQRNRSSNRLLTVAGETMCVASWSERTGVRQVTIIRRLILGWSDERAVSEGVRPMRAGLTVDGETLPTREWAKRVGIKENTISCRLRLGWSERDAVFGRSRGGSR
jgi:hypothetical protein